MIIRATSFDRWLSANFTRSELADITNHGADTGYAGLTYSSDLKALWNKFDEEIYDLVYEYAVGSAGYDSVPAFLAAQNRCTDSAGLLVSVLVWTAAEVLAYAKTNND
jgi:hypothetical protein